MNKSLFELDLAPGKVVSVSHRATLKDCFTAIMGYKISGVAVVDEGGRLVGTISASDLKVCAHTPSFLGFLHATQQVD